MSSRLLAAGISCLLLLQACAGTGIDHRVPPENESGITLEGIVILNQLAYPVTDVMVEAPATGNFAGCGNILPRSSCSTSFEARNYRRNPILVRWKEYGEPHQLDEFVVELPEGLPPGSVVWLEVVIFAMGQAGARLISRSGP